MGNKRCPFCGGEDVVLTGQPITGQFVVVCNGCGAMGPWKDSDQEAWDVWSHRPNLTPEALMRERTWADDYMDGKFGALPEIDKEVIEKAFLENRATKPAKED